MAQIEPVEGTSQIIGQQDAPDPVSLPLPDQPAPTVIPEVAAGRAAKMDQGGVSDVLQKTTQEVQSGIENGQETDLRQQAAANLDIARQKQKQSQLVAMTQKYGPLSSEQIQGFLDPFNPVNQSTDPDMVVEQQYAKSVIGQLATAPGFLGTDNVFDMASQSMPELADRTLANATDLSTKNEYLLHKLQDAQQAASQQSWTGWGIDQLKGATQLYPEYMERGLVDNIYGDLGLGSNKQDQSDALYHKPIDDFKQTVDTIYKKLDGNPSLRVQFLSDMQGTDTFQKTLDNAFTALAIPDMALGAKGLKMILTRNQINKAAKDMVSAAAKDPTANPVNIVAATGDVKESAVLQVADGVMKAMDGSVDPMNAAEKTLLTGWKTLEANYTANPGTYLSREAQTRILDQTAKQGPDFVNRITTMTRVERQPLAKTSQDVIRANQEEIRNDFKGPNAMVADVDGPFLEPASGTNWYRMHLVDYDGGPFHDAETAAGRTEQLGFGTVEGQAPEKVYLPEAAVYKDEHSDLVLEGANGKKIYQPGSVRKVFRDDLEVTRTEQGVSFQRPDTTVRGDRVEYTPSVTPQAGLVPYNLKTNKFEPTLTEGTAKIEQQGLGFFITHWVPMKETSDLNRNLMIRTPGGDLIPETISHSSASGTKSIVNSLLGWVRNSEETMALNESIQRKAVAYSQTNIQRWAHDLQKPINKIRNADAWWKPTAYLGKVTGKEVRSQFERALDYARQTQAWFKGPGELQDFYLRNFRRDPSPLETEAYFNYVKVVEGDRMLGEIAEFRNRARVGAEQHRISLLGADGKPIFSNYFDGVVLKRWPSNTDQVLVTGDKQGEERVVQTDGVSSKVKKDLEDKLTKGELKLIEVYDQDHYPLDGFTDKTSGERIRYVLTNSAESKPISFNHVNRVEGGHFDWDYDYWLKQADMRQQKSGKHVYVGDTTVMPLEGRAHGGNIAKLWNEAQEHIKNDDWASAKPIVQKMGIDWQTFTGWYKPGRDATGKAIRAKFNANEPMYVVQKGKNILSIDDSLPKRYLFKDRNGNNVNRFEDGTRSGFANNFKVAYNTERRTDYNFSTINDVGTKERPVYQYQPAKLVDALPTMNRALNRAINSAFMDDYKLYAIEHWLREAEPHLEADNPAAIRSAPFWYYNEAKFKSSTPVNIKWNLLSHKYKIDSFVGLPSKFDTWVHTFTQHLADVAYDRYGPEASRTALQKVSSITPIWLLQHVKNPVDFIRSVTFNFKLGLFNPAQFLVQAQTHALIWSLEPTHGTVGTFAMLLHGWSRVNKNPDILRALDNTYTKLNMFGSKARPGEFLEAMKELENSGFEHVAGEYANLSKAYTPTTNFLKGDIEAGLKIGQTPFRLGEQSTRITAWYTAFRKFRAENPNVPITNIERGKILQHADLLTVNMSRASSSMINHGVFSMSTQFLSYQIKLAELFLGSRINNAARARMVAGFSLLYGFPNAIGVTGAPFSDNVREHLIDDLGYVPGEKWVSTMLNEGFPAWAYAMATGTLPNVGDRFGSQGWQNIKDAMRSDVPWWQALGGASVGTMGNFVSAGLDPFYQGALSWARGDTGDNRFTIKGSDLIEPFKEISTVNAAMKYWTAMQTGQWISKNEQYVTDVDQLQAAVLSATGMNPQAQDDMFVKNNIVKGEEQAFKKAEKEFNKDWGRAITAFGNNDPEQGNAYVRNAMSRLTAVGYPPDMIPKLMAEGNQGVESAIDAADWSYWTRGDVSKQQERLDNYLRTQKLKEQH